MSAEQAYRAAIDAGDRPAAFAAAAELTRELADLSRAVPPAQGFQLVWAAAGRRWFDLAEWVAAALAGRADATPAAQRLHAQFVLERGFVDEAEQRLERLLAAGRLDAFDRSETLGHLGRIHKTRFLDALRARADPAPALAASIRRYLEGWRAQGGDASWHGANALALLARPEAARLGPLADPAWPSVPALAAALDAWLARSDPAGARAYTIANRTEIALARADLAAALSQVQRFVAPDFATTFELGATLRQIEQMWDLDRRPSPGPELLALMRAELMQRGQAALRIGGASVKQALKSLDAMQRGGAAQLEAVFGADRFSSIENYRRGLQRCAAVARIGRSAEVGTGTGFLLPAATLNPAWAKDAWLLVTNAHVISENDAERAGGALHPQEAVITFAALDGVDADDGFEIERIVFSSPPAALDVCIVALKGLPPAPPPYPVAAVLPAQGAKAEARIIGHPSGRGLSLSSNELLDHEAPRLHYLTATEGGSSGSPVFNADWKLIAIHHAGGDRLPRLNGHAGHYAANEGIWIESIRAALAKT